MMLNEVVKNISADEREAGQIDRLQVMLGDGHKINDLSDLAALPVTRKDALLQSQAENPPFGVLKPSEVATIYQSPGPIYEPGLTGPDPWRFGRFIAAIGMTAGDIVQNTFAYHFTPAGAMFETGARAVGATVFPAGPGNSSQQAEVAAAIKTTGYAGTPDFLATILAKADEEGLDLSAIKRAAVSAGPLFPQLRQAYSDRGITCRQCYGTADVGLIAYETEHCIDGMFIDDDVIVEIVSPGTGDWVPEGEIGEVLVTVLNPAHPILRFSVGDLSAMMVGGEVPGETRRRIVGWRGRADQATKVKGMFIRPEQVSGLVSAHPGISRARVEVSRDGNTDRIDVKLESQIEDVDQLAALVQQAIKLRANVTVVEGGSLPRDGVLVADLRDIEG